MKSSAKTTPTDVHQASAADTAKATKASSGAKVVHKGVVKPAKNMTRPPLVSDDPFAGIDDLPLEEFLEGQKELLAIERATYVGQALMLRAEADQLAADMEPGEVQFDDESGEGATVNVEREFDLAMSAQAAAAVEEIDRAIARMAADKYGRCEGCAKPIPRARLRALPHATLCIACKNGGLSRR